jgi:MarR family transcriptional regulator, organic hydroperoxide resistance regulator
MSAAPPVDRRADSSAPLDAGRSSPQLTPALADLGLAFRHVFRTLSRLRGRDTHLGGSELSHAQFELLIELDERGELSAGELAAAARLTPATVTQMLEHLAACGHVERVRSQSDRRVVLTRLTEQGREKIEAKRLTWESRWLQALDGVAEHDLRAATSVLERLGEMFENAPVEGECATGETVTQETSQAPS